MMDYELTEEQLQAVTERNERTQRLNREREENRRERKAKLEEQKTEYSLLRAEMLGLNRQISELNGDFNDRRMELGDAAQTKRDVIADVRDHTIQAARQEYYDVRKVESDKYTAEFTSIYTKLREDTDIVQDDFDEAYDELVQQRKVVVKQIRNFSWE